MYGWPFNICTRDVIEWLHGLHGLNEISVNAFPRDVHGMNKLSWNGLNELSANVRPRGIHGLIELSVRFRPHYAQESRDVASESGIHGINIIGWESSLNGMNFLNELFPESAQ